LGVAATGLGKTVCFSFVAKENKGTTLILAHRDELISQAVDKLLQSWPEADVGVVKAERNEYQHDVVVASVQTLARESRRERIPRDHFTAIVCDEAHHSKSPSYQNIFEYFGANREINPPLLLGVTATPDRGDGKGLDDVYDEIVFNYDILWGIRAGYLCDLKGKRITLQGVDFSKAKVRQGDFDAGQTGRMLEEAHAPEVVVQAWLEHGEDRKTIVFTPTVATAVAFADEYNKVGVNAAWISGETPQEERRETLRRFARDEIKVLANCAILLEGYDEPSVSCIVMARPIKSRALYSQAIGRGTRKHPGKQNCLILDVCGATQHSLISVPSLFGIENPQEFEDGGSGVAQVLMEQEEEAIRKGAIVAAEIDLFRKVLESPIAWVTFQAPDGQNSYSCSLGSPDAGTVTLEAMEADGKWRSLVRWRAGNGPTGTLKYPNGDPYRVLMEDIDLETAQGMGEDYVRKNGVVGLVNRDAPWRQRPPTPKQLSAAEKWRFPVDRKWNAGELSDALGAHIEAKTAKGRTRETPDWVKRKIERERAQKR